MGHSTAHAALIYRHAGAGRDRLIADAASNLVSKGRKKKPKTNKQDRKPKGHAGGPGGLIRTPGNDQGQAEESSSDLALSRRERATGIEPA
jgi:hypothetical protein